jgi:hypothetical protein
MSSTFTGDAMKLALRHIANGFSREMGSEQLIASSSVKGLHHLIRHEKGILLAGRHNFLRQNFHQEPESTSQFFFFFFTNAVIRIRTER